MTYKALFIGADYRDVQYRKLDNSRYAIALSEHIKTIYNAQKDNFDIITDTTACKSSYDGILFQLYKLGLETWSSTLDTVFIYYIGDSISITDYVQAYSGKYSDITQGIVPCDYTVRGVIDMSKVFKILQQYNPKTKIIFIADSCFLNSNIFNLEYDWFINNISAYRRQNRLVPNKIKQKIITISCNLAQYNSDDDNYYTMLQNNENMKSIGDFLVKLTYINDDIFGFTKDMNSVLMNKRINMLVSIASSYDLSMDDKNIFKCFEAMDNFLDYMDIYDDVTDNIRNWNKLIHIIPQNIIHVPHGPHGPHGPNRPLQQFTIPVYNMYPYQSVQPIQRLYECYC